MISTGICLDLRFWGNWKKMMLLSFIWNWGKGCWNRSGWNFTGNNRG